MLELVNFLLEMEDSHPDFRIWITTEPHKNFPISLLQMSIKFTYEPPRGKKEIILFFTSISIFSCYFRNKSRFACYI